MLLSSVLLLAACSTSSFDPPERNGPIALVDAGSGKQAWLAVIQEEERSRNVGGGSRRVGSWVTESIYHLRLQAHDPATAKRLAEWSGRSDPASVAAYFREDLAADFRPGLSAIDVPVLVISPYNAADFGNGPQAFSEADKTAYYTALMQGTPDLSVVSISPSRHFAMFDQPERLSKAIDDFLRRLERD